AIFRNLETTLVLGLPSIFRGNQPTAALSIRQLLAEQRVLAIDLECHGEDTLGLIPACETDDNFLSIGRLGGPRLAVADRDWLHRAVIKHFQREGSIAVQDRMPMLSLTNFSGLLEKGLVELSQFLVAAVECAPVKALSRFA